MDCSAINKENFHAVTPPVAGILGITAVVLGILLYKGLLISHPTDTQYIVLGTTFGLSALISAIYLETARRDN